MASETPQEPSRTRFAWLLAVVFVLLAGSAMLRTSTTFDEIIFSAVGARGLLLGDFSMVNDHPRLAQYLFGLPLYLAGIQFPQETGSWEWYTRYHYARTLYWAAGNPGEVVAALARLPALALGAATVLATFFLARRRLGERTALFAAVLVAFLPDLLAHAGVAYNDVPLAFGLLVSVFALDAAVRNPAAWRVGLAALACALTVAVKYSGIVVLPILAALLACEAASGRWRDAAWRRGVLLAIPLFALAAWLTLALLYGGDWRLAEFVSGLREITRTSVAGRPAFLLGQSNSGGWWYFFPVALALKTPAALHVLVVVALVALAAAWRAHGARALLAHPARAAAVGAGLFLAALLAARVNIGVRHALPMLPLACILVAAGLAWAWERARRPGRLALGALLAAYVASSALHYPWFLSYLSEYAWGRPTHRTLVDSNTDWGQGLVALRGFMRSRGIEQVALGYFGSALPEGYGIRYVPLPSYFELPGGVEGRPRYVAVSATLLTGLYVRGDPYAALRDREPVAVLGGSIYVFDMASAR